MAAAVRSTACTLVRKHGIPPGIACKMAARAVLRARGLPIPAGLGATPPPPPSGAPDVLAQINAAGDDPAVVAARGAVSKWSWLIPVGGLLMSLKRKVSEWRTPTSAAIVGAGRRR
jgi:hypothetical protein